jgi:hypothetical protein
MEGLLRVSRQPVILLPPGLSNSARHTEMVTEFPPLQLAPQGPSQRKTNLINLRLNHYTLILLQITSSATQISQTWKLSGDFGVMVGRTKVTKALLASASGSKTYGG